MGTTPEVPVPNDDGTADGGPAAPTGAPGAEIGITEDGGGTFEPEEDPGPGD